MNQQEKDRGTLDPMPVQVPDVATTPHGMHALTGDTPPMGDGLLQDVLPSVSEAARQVGGFRRLAEIANQLEQASEESIQPGRSESR